MEPFGYGKKVRWRTTHSEEILPVRHYGTVVCLGVAWGIRTIAPLAKDLEAAGNQIVSILGANDELDLLWEEAVRLVSDEVIVATLDGSRGKPLHVGFPLFGRLSQGDVDLVVAVGPGKDVERLRDITKAQGCTFVALPVEH